MQGKRVLITGATDGIGRQTALDLAKMGAGVLLHGRDAARLKSAGREMERATGNSALGMFLADLASLEQVRGLADQVLAEHPRLDVLINNAGVYEARRTLTVDGFERTLAVNHLASFLLTRLLMDSLEKAGSARIVNVSSEAHASRIEFENLQGERKYTGYGAYSQSKLCSILFTVELAEKIRGTGVTANCLHPGVINTKLLRSGWAGGVGKPVSEGSRNSVYVATAPELEGITGQYFVAMRPAMMPRAASDQDVRGRLWKISEELTGAECQA